MPASLEKIHELLASDSLDESEKWVIRWQFQMLGEFDSALATAITKADVSNLACLQRGFPMQVNGYVQWAFAPALGMKLRGMGLDI